MNERIKSLIFLAKPVMKAVLTLFFDRRYLAGRYFDNSLSGYLWGFRAIWQRNILRLGRPMPFPVGLTCRVSNGKRILFHPDDLNNFQSPGTYLQNFSGTIKLGHGCYIGPNVGIITSNHDPLDLDNHLPPKDVEIGEKCWIGMNSVLLPGVVLGPKTIVGAGSVVTKSFPEGKCIIAGNPARKIKILSENVPI
ncbi:acyltransferase [Aquamicrobium defluvii]|uniref:Transferase family hexapeptide repeat protein n=1 Tax=Aquamicrobium defluvii TaxID=69279 RepID=A0A4R6YFE6_9HYPH|nr:acyltransferase [Aquamicrobium defluvii]TDR34869.1 transferase family hexapeptide repeat protein [Aquamicrobium defluvii]